MGIFLKFLKIKQLWRIFLITQNGFSISLYANKLRDLKVNVFALEGRKVQSKLSFQKVKAKQKIIKKSIFDLCKNDFRRTLYSSF